MNNRGTYTCINHPLPGLGHIFVYNDSHLSLNQQYVLTVESLSLLISFLYLDLCVLGDDSCIS